MSILQLPAEAPRVILFDWHGTLVETRGAMYHALDEVLPQLEQLGLLQRLLEPEQSRTGEDARLVAWIRHHRRLHPRIVSEGRVSRTDLFELLFGEDDEAKQIAHAAFDEAYAHHLQSVRPIQPDALAQLQALRDLGLRLGVLTNRRRLFLDQELAQLDEGRWRDLFQVTVCGDEVARRKPAPDMLLKALFQLGAEQDIELEGCWYLGDSTTDVAAACEAGVTPLFFNGAGWAADWIDRIFPGTARHPHQPRAVIRDLGELVRLARHLLAQELRVRRARDSGGDHPSVPDR